MLESIDAWTNLAREGNNEVDERRNEDNMDKFQFRGHFNICI